MSQPAGDVFGPTWPRVAQQRAIEYTPSVIREVSMSRSTRSGELLRRATVRIPGGVNSPVRAFGAVGGDPLFIERGEGPWIQDVDGNRYS